MNGADQDKNSMMTDVTIVASVRDGADGRMLLASQWEKLMNRRMEGWKKIAFLVFFCFFKKKKHLILAG